MLDQKDIQLLEKMFEKSQQNIINTVDEKITHSETRILKEVDNKITASETRMQKEFDTKMDERFTNSENMILREMDRMQERMDKRMDDIQRNIDELNQYYRISKWNQIRLPCFYRCTATCRSRSQKYRPGSHRRQKNLPNGKQ